MLVHTLLCLLMSASPGQACDQCCYVTAGSSLPAFFHRAMVMWWCNSRRVLKWFKCMLKHTHTLQTLHILLHIDGPSDHGRANYFLHFFFQYFHVVMTHRFGYLWIYISGTNWCMIKYVCEGLWYMAHSVTLCTKSHRVSSLAMSTVVNLVNSIFLVLLSESIQRRLAKGNWERERKREGDLHFFMSRYWEPWATSVFTTTRFNWETGTGMHLYLFIYFHLFNGLTASRCS